MPQQLPQIPILPIRHPDLRKTIFQHQSQNQLRILADQGAAFVMLDRRGKVLAVTGPVSSSDAKLRRAQALALGNGTALKISQGLISQKLAGQELLVRDMLHDPATAGAIARFRVDLSGAESIESVRLIESQAARAYWQAWSDLPILWPRKDERRVGTARRSVAAANVTRTR